MKKINAYFYKFSHLSLTQYASVIHRFHLCLATQKLYIKKCAANNTHQQIPFCLSFRLSLFSVDMFLFLVMHLDNYMYHIFRKSFTLYFAMQLLIRR